MVLHCQELQVCCHHVLLLTAQVGNLVNAQRGEHTPWYSYLFFALSGAQLAGLRAFISNMSAMQTTVAKGLSYSSDNFEYCTFLAVQPFLELLLVTVVASTVACLIKQSMQC